MEKTFRSNKIGQEKLAIIAEKVIERFDELLEILGVELKKDKKMYVGCCPIHGGDRDSAFNIFHSGDSIVGNWKCRTHQCQEIFKPTLVGFVRGVLSHRKYDWQAPRDQIYSFADTITFLESFLNQNLDDLKIDIGAVDKKRAADHVTRFYARKVDVKKKIPRALVRRNIKTPQYYISRGYSKKILDKYDVTYCDDPNKEMYKRCVAPIYDDEHKYMIGCTGRSIFEKCDVCGAYHNPTSPCPLPEDSRKYSKWKHNYGFKAEDWLYNYWYAKRHIFETKCAVLVESPGNVWKLEEGNVHNSIGLFGTSLTLGQLDLLNKCGAMNIIIAMDNDNAGQVATDYLIRDLEKLYNVELLEYEEDIGEMQPEIIRTKLLPVIERSYI